MNDIMAGWEPVEYTHTPPMKKSLLDLLRDHKPDLDPSYRAWCTAHKANTGQCYDPSIQRYRCYPCYTKEER